MDRLRGLLLLAVGLGVMVGGGLLIGSGPEDGRAAREESRWLWGSGFVNAWDDAGPAASPFAGEAVALTAPAATTVVIWNHGTVAQGEAISCFGPKHFPPPPVMRLERLPGVRVWTLCTDADQTAGPEAYFAARAEEIRALARRFREAELPPGRLFLAGQSGGATSAALALAGEPEAFGGAILYAMAWEGRGEGTLRRVGRGAPYGRRIVATLEGAEAFPALVVGFEADAWNDPDDLAFLSRAHPGEVTAFSPGCGAGHGGAYHGCGVEAVAAKTAAWLAARIGLAPPE